MDWNVRTGRELREHFIKSSYFTDEGSEDRKEVKGSWIQDPDAPSLRQPPPQIPTSLSEHKGGMGE